VQEEQREDSPLLRASERERSPIRSDLQRAQDAEFELFRASERSALGSSIQAHTKLQARCGQVPAVPHLMSLACPGRRAREMEDPQDRGSSVAGNVNPFT
jgi:hypothetical protein